MASVLKILTGERACLLATDETARRQASRVARGFWRVVDLFSYESTAVTRSFWRPTDSATGPAIGERARNMETGASLFFYTMSLSGSLVALFLFSLFFGVSVSTSFPRISF